ncbi:hypothetical protein CI610_02464 [invertebrate metagenome]|uniref:Uncharacterized protein n=1 Tax=invertebrate metagenome TaxID=1711999 RepID=A0A2H9T5V7_9ZZZZ
MAFERGNNRYKDISDERQAYELYGQQCKNRTTLDQDYQGNCFKSQWDTLLSFLTQSEKMVHEISQELNQKVIKEVIKITTECWDTDDEYFYEFSSVEQGKMVLVANAEFLGIEKKLNQLEKKSKVAYERQLKQLDENHEKELAHNKKEVSDTKAALEKFSQKWEVVLDEDLVKKTMKWLAGAEKEDVIPSIELFLTETFRQLEQETHSSRLDKRIDVEYLEQRLEKIYKDIKHCKNDSDSLPVQLELDYNPLLSFEEALKKAINSEKTEYRQTVLHCMKRMEQDLDVTRKLTLLKELAKIQWCEENLKWCKEECSKEVSEPLASLSDEGLSLQNQTLVVYSQVIEILFQKEANVTNCLLPSSGRLVLEDARDQIEEVTNSLNQIITTSNSRLASEQPVEEYLRVEVELIIDEGLQPIVNAVSENNNPAGYFLLTHFSEACFDALLIMKENQGHPPLQVLIDQEIESAGDGLLQYVDDLHCGEGKGLWSVAQWVYEKQPELLTKKAYEEKAPDVKLLIQNLNGMDQGDWDGEYSKFHEEVLNPVKAESKLPLDENGLFNDDASRALAQLPPSSNAQSAATFTAPPVQAAPMDATEDLFA